MSIVQLEPFSVGILVVTIIAVIPGILSQNEDWTIGPFVRQDADNPIMGPLDDTEFFCPVRRANVLWEEKDVFNPAAIVKDGVVHMLYRAEDYDGKFNGTSRIGLATSTDGIHFTRESLPVFYPDNDNYNRWEWEGGCEDPRIVQLATHYWMTYTAYDGTTARLCIAASSDLRTWTKRGPIFREAGYLDLWSKAGAIITRQSQVDGQYIVHQIDNKFWMYWGETSIFMAWSTDMANWTPLTDDQIGLPGNNLTVVFGPREGKFDSDIVEPGPQAVLTDAGIVLIYNGRNYGADEGGDPSIPKYTYSAGQALMNASVPWQMLNRTEQYFMTPEKDYELDGQVNNVVFVEGLVHFQDKWFLYYGTADSKIAVTVAGGTGMGKADASSGSIWLIAFALIAVVQKL